MKKVLVSCFVLMAFVLPSLAQAHDYNVNDVEPGVIASIPVSQVPPAVVSAVSLQFDKSNPVTWSKFPFALKEYGWVYDIGAENVALDRYEVKMITDKKTDLWAVYTNKGELVETREVSTNIAVPASVMKEFQQSKYKDWKIVGSKEVIRFYHDHEKNSSNVEQHFRISVEKDGVKRNISFNWQGTN